MNWLSNLSKTTQSITGRARTQTWIDLASQYMHLNTILNCLLIGRWQAGKFMHIPKGNYHSALGAMQEWRLALARNFDLSGKARNNGSLLWS